MMIGWNILVLLYITGSSALIWASLVQNLLIDKHNSVGWIREKPVKERVKVSKYKI